MVWRVITTVTLVSVLILICIVGFWVIFPYRILTETENVHILTPSVRPGGSVVIELHFCKNYPMTEITSRELVDGFVYMLPTVQTYEPLGCYNRRIFVPIPEVTPEGSYKIITRAEFHPNPFRTISYSWETDKFVVKK